MHAQDPIERSKQFTTKSTKEDTKITYLYVIFVSSFVLFVVNYGGLGFPMRRAQRFKECLH
jgi:hypothetical protein